MLLAVIRHTFYPFVQHVARAVITSRLDYCNAMFTIVSSKDLARLQRLQNSAARVIFALSRRVHVDASPLLETLHWLPVSSWITFKILMYVFKILNGQAPGYLIELETLHWLPVSSRITFKILMYVSGMIMGSFNFAWNNFWLMRAQRAFHGRGSRGPLKGPWRGPGAAPRRGSRGQRPGGGPGGSAPGSSWVLAFIWPNGGPFWYGKMRNIITNDIHKLAIISNNLTICHQQISQTRVKGKSDQNRILPSFGQGQVHLFHVI